jgi:alginate O-acetyltransferase complex protein AlgI
MLFNSITFLIFFPIVTTLYYVLPHRSRWAMLFLAGCYFYMCFIPAYILFLFFLIVVDFVAAQLIENNEGFKRKVYLIFSLAVTGLALFYFKYHDFFLHNTARIFSLWGWHINDQPLKLILPIGLSFHTFQSLAYVIEVYNRRYKAEKHLGYYAVYVLFYPQLVAGPIERPQNLLFQLKSPIVFTYDNAVAGLRLMLWGFFKKMVVADRLGVIVDHVYAHPGHWDGFSIIFATILFAFQIYGDFSGYTDIARGSARVMGIDLMQNFKRPYTALNITEFWHRWHISLSTWFRDYVYVPLGGNKKGNFNFIRNIMITFILSGLWHGANWTFLIWGALNGFYLVVQRFWLKVSLFKKMAHGFSQHFPKLAQFFSWALTFAAINLTWVFFRSESISKALEMLCHVLSGEGEGVIFMADFQFLYVTALAVIFMVGLEQVCKEREFHEWVGQYPRRMRWMIYYLLLELIFFIGFFQHRQFIYFQF